jgi:hypothetical protein
MSKLGMNLYAADFALFPHHVGNNHWVLLKLFLKGPATGTLLCFDSLRYDDTTTLPAAWKLQASRCTHIVEVLHEQEG